MKLFVFTVKFLNQDQNVEYEMVKGVYDNKQLAKESVLKELHMQQEMWKDSYTVKLGKAKMGLISKDGYSKVYSLIEKELNQ